MSDNEGISALPDFKYIDMIMESVEVKQLQFFCLKNTNTKEQFDAKPSFRFSPYSNSKNESNILNKNSKKTWKNKDSSDKKCLYVKIEL